MSEDRKTWWRRLSAGLTKTKSSLGYQVKSIFSGERLVDEDWERLEETLLAADVGVDTTMLITEHLRERVVEQKIFDPEILTGILREELTARLTDVDGGFDLASPPVPAVVLVVGVNGTGKTTTIGKLAYFLKQRPSSVTLVAADTFRAAAVEQLELWAGRAGVDIVKHQRGADPAAVVYDGIQSMRAQRHDFALVDTAGRLHTYVNLMEELKKIQRVARREAGSEIALKTVMVMDATTGQNGIAQAQLFNEALDLDGIVLSKLDGTAKGGIILAIQRRLGVPVVAVGTGEQIEDMAPFSAAEFADALLAP
jgi:fused signal recognition particle receptor